MADTDPFAEAAQLESIGEWGQATEAYRRLATDDDLAKRCRAHIRLARCLLETCKRGETDEAEEVLADAAILVAGLDDPQLSGELLLQQGRLDEHQGLLQRALDRYVEARRFLASTETDLTEIELALASAERRRGQLNDALARLQGMNVDSLDPRCKADYLDELGAVLINRGETRRAMEVLEQGLELDRSGASEYAAGRSRLLLAQACMRSGQRERAKSLIEEAMKVYDRTRAEAGLSDASALMGNWYEEGGDYVSAAHFYQESYDFDRSSDDRLGQARAKRRLARTYRKRGDTARARELLADARRLSPREDDVEAAALCSEEAHLALAGSDPDYEKAIFLFRRALEIAQEDGDDRVTALAKRNLARALREDDQLEAARNLLVEAKATLLARGDLRELDDLLDDLGEVLLEQSRYVEASDCLLQSLELDEQLGRVASKARTLSLLGRVCVEMGERERAGQYFRDALSLYRQARHDVGLSDTLQHLGAWYLEQGRLDSAIECFQEGLEIDNRLNDPLGRVRVKRQLAAVARLRGNLERADEYLREAQRDLGQIDDPVERAFLDLERGRLALAEGAYRDARDRLEAARTVFEDVGRRVDVASCQRFIALAVAYEGNYGEALSLLEQAKAVFEEAKDVPELDELYDDLGTVYLLSGRPDLAEESVRQSLDVASRSSWNHGRGRSLLLLGRIAMQTGDLAAAKQHIEAARTACVAVDDEVGEAESHLLLGDWYVDRLNNERDFAGAVAAYKQARRLEQYHRDRRGVARCNRKLAHVYIERHEYVRAEEALDDAEANLRGIDDPREIAPLEYQIARLWAARNEPGRAITHVRRALEGFIKLSQAEERTAAYQLLVTCHQAKGEMREALEYLREMGIERASMYNVLVKDLHPLIAQASHPSYVASRYGDAIVSAFRVLEQEFRLRVADGPEATGVKPIWQVISTWVDSGGVDSLFERKQARDRFRDFCIGSFALLRNPAAHSDTTWSAADAFAALSVAHLIAQRLDAVPAP